MRSKTKIFILFSVFIQNHYFMFGSSCLKTKPSMRTFPLLLFTSSWKSPVICLNARFCDPSPSLLYTYSDPQQIFISEKYVLPTASFSESYSIPFLHIFSNATVLNYTNLGEIIVPRKDKTEKEISFLG